MADQTTSKPENKMGYMPINKLLMTMSLPMMASMLVQALYNVVDSIFVAKINEDALTAVSLAFPLQSIMISVAIGTAVGINALLSRHLGEKDFEKANQVAENGIFLAFVSFLVFAVVGLTLVKPFYATQGASQIIQQYGVDYLTICCTVSVGIFLQATFERILQATGRTIYTMYTQGAGAIINLILDPLLIFGIGPFPVMGVKGAATATVIGQICAAILAIYFNHTKNHDVSLSLKTFRPTLSIIGGIYAIGVPSMVVQGIGSIMVYGLNKILIAFNSTAVAVFGVYFKLQSFVFMPVFGLNSGMVPIIAYNYGAGNKERVIKTHKVAVFYAVAIMFAGFLIFQIMPKQLLLLFSASDSMIAMGVPALRLISTSFLVAGYAIVTGSLFQALGDAVYSMINSICRQLVVLLPAAYLLSLTGNVNAVWLAFPIAEVASLVLTTVFLIRIRKRKINHIGE
ncbi:MAG: MATE family efflux transporter [Lachnospiraceae bacterium]|nr:MATE family efflux transporter [Lachnospiraceae bacterium]